MSDPRLAASTSHRGVGDDPMKWALGSTGPCDVTEPGQYFDFVGQCTASFDDRTIGAVFKVGVRPKSHYHRLGIARRRDKLGTAPSFPH